MARPVLVSCQAVCKAFGERPLFDGLSFALHEGDRVGLIGPNGVGKSTLLKILAGHETPDAGQCSRRNGLRIGFVPQHPSFDPDQTVERIVGAASGADDHRTGIALSRTGFVDPALRAGSLSGGWRTRLAIACALVGEPDLLLLDEPTNHLDVDSIVWLESLLDSRSTAFVAVSHDRYFLQRTARRMIDVDRVYPAGLLSVDGAYAELLEARAALLASEESARESLANRVRNEVAWLRRGAKARTSKAKARVDAAERSRSELAGRRERASSNSFAAGIELSASGRKTKRLWYGKGLRKSFGGNVVVEGLELLLTPGMRLGVVGPIGSGKSTLLRMIVGELEPDAGEIRRVDDLKTVYFDQDRRGLEEGGTLARALAPEGDSVVYRDRPVHVASWARRFLFRPEQLDQPVSELSGGERARVVLARLMLQPADLLVLDEPTNDLDIATLEVLEESLIDFPGALVLVSHDRYLVDRVATAILGLDGSGVARRFADLDQWQTHRQAAARRSREGATSSDSTPARPKAKRLSYLEQREWEGMEERVLAAEARMGEARARADDPAIVADAAALQERVEALQQAELEVDRLYERWAELEEKVR